MIPFLFASFLALPASPEATSTHRFPIDAIVSDARDPAELHPLEAFLLERLPKAIPEVARIAFVHTTRRRFGADESSPSVTTGHEIEVEGRPGFDPAPVREYLARFAERSATTLRVHATVVESARKTGSGEEPLRAEVVLLPEFEWRRRRTEAERAGQEGGTVVSANESDVRSGATALLSTAKEVAYVADFELTQTGETLIADPVIGTVSHGILVAATPILHPDGATLTLDVTVTIAGLELPMKTIESNLGVGAPVTIQVPEVRQVRWDSGPLELPLETAQFVVRGLYAPPSGGANGAPGRAIDVFLLVCPVGAGATAGRAGGRVYAVDAESGLAFLTFVEGRREGDRFDVFRDGARVGIVELARSDAALRFAVARSVSGSLPRVGDEIR